MIRAALRSAGRRVALSYVDNVAEGVAAVARGEGVKLRYLACAVVRVLLGVALVGLAGAGERA